MTDTLEKDKWSKIAESKRQASETGSTSHWFESKARDG